MNTDVVANEEVNTIQTTKKDAETMGAIAFFGDKYGDRVRVVRAGAHSLEFCGGTHVDRLGDIGQIQIVSEASIGSNTRRIEGVSAMGAYQRSHDMETALGSVASYLKSSVDDVVPALERIIERQREFEKELSSLRQAQLSRFAEELHAQITSRRVGSARRRLPRRTTANTRGRPPATRPPCCRAGRGVGGQGVDRRGERRAVDATSAVKQLAGLVGGGGGGSARLALAGGRNPGGIDAVLRAAAAL